MLTEEEKATVKELKAQGYTTSQIAAHLGAKRVNGTSSIESQKLKAFREKEAAETPLANKITDAVGLGGAVDVFGSALARRGIGTDVSTDITQQFIEAPSTREMAGAVLQTAAVPASIAITGGASLPGQVLAGAGIGYLYDIGSDLAQNKSTAEVLTPGMGTIFGAAAPLAISALGATARGVSGLASTASDALSSTASKVVPEGAAQIGQETLERIPRALDRGQEALQTAAERRARIAAASPTTQQAIKSGLDDVLITAVEQADEPTKAAYRQMVEIAESPRTGLRPAVRPESIAGEAVADQYTILDKTRRSVGAELGDAVDKISTKGAVDVLPAQRSMRDLLRQNGILPDRSGVLNFSQSSLTPKQQGLVQQLYEIATRSEQMTPRQVYNIDKLFSQLQREARFDGLDSVYLSTPDGDINAFRAFRNIFSNQLDQIAPEIEPLNTQYAQLRNLQDDIEDTIVRRGNYDSTRNVDPAEFAQTNLRRAFSDAASAADYRALADKLDAFARGNGYKGANPLDLSGFATRLREIYPEAVPETSATKLFGGGVKGMLEKVLDIGEPTAIDKQRALKALLEDSFNQGEIPQTIKNPKLEAFRRGEGSSQGGYVRFTEPLGGKKPPQVQATRQAESLTNNTPPSLLEEAKKYKSAEEFYIARKANHFTNEKFDNFDIGKTADQTIWFTTKNTPEGLAATGGDIKMERALVPKKVAGWDEYDAKSLSELQQEGFDLVELPDDSFTDYIVLDPSVIKTRTQLEDIWKQANKK